MTSRCSHCKRLFWFTEILGKNGPWAPLIPGLSKRQSNVMFMFLKRDMLCHVTDRLSAYECLVSLVSQSYLSNMFRLMLYSWICQVMWYIGIKYFMIQNFMLKFVFIGGFLFYFFIFKSTMYEWLSFAPDDASQPSLPSFIISPLLHILSQVFLCCSYLTVIKMYCLWIPQCSLCSALPANLSS